MKQRNKTKEEEMVAEQIQKHPSFPEVMEEVKNMTDIGIPMLAMGLVNYLRNMIIVACMGRLGSLELAGGALAIGFINITGYSVLSGLAMGMEPLCSQAFGSKNSTIASLNLQRTILMLIIASLPIGMIWVNLEPFMLKLHQDPEITHIAGLYCRYAAPDLIVNSLLHPLRIYLRSKGTTWPLFWCTSFATVLLVPTTIILAFTFQLGVKGIAISNFIANFNTLVFLLCYILFTRTPNDPLSKPLVTKSIPVSSTGSLGEEWGALLRLAIPSCLAVCCAEGNVYMRDVVCMTIADVAIPSCLAVCLEWWWYEFMTLAAGYLSEPRASLATSAIVIQTTSLMYTLPSALSMSVSTRVGNELGAGRPGKARLATVVAIGISLLTSSFGVLWTTLGRKVWARVFTNDSEVLTLTMAALPIIGVCELANCPQTTCCGALRGSTRLAIGARINFYSFYLVGVPVAIALAFVWHLEFLGLCYGLLAAQVACVFSMLTVIYKTDWERESSKASHLVGEINECAYEDGIRCEEGVDFLK